MIELGVTLDAVAVLRESRNARTPDPVFCGFLAQQAGAAAVNVQLRNDRRHIQERDVHLLRDALSAELNLVVPPSQEMLHFALAAKPDRVTFIPERLETAGGGGLDVLLNTAQLRERVREMRESTIFPSIFIDPVIDQVKAAHQIGALGVELSAMSFAAISDPKGLARDREGWERELQKLSDCARLADKLELHVGVGHGLTLANAAPLVAIAGLSRVNVGHDLVARSTTVGFEAAVHSWMELLWNVRRN